MQNLLFLNVSTPEIIILLIIAAGPLVLMAICLVDIIRSDFKDSITKLLWILIVLFAPLLGSLIYLLLGRSQKTVRL